MSDHSTGALRHPDMREKKQVTVRMTAGKPPYEEDHE